MAVQDQSAYMEYTARSVCKTGTDSIDLLSGGSMDPEHANMIRDHIRRRLRNSTWATSGIVPEPLYYEVAVLMLPHTSGLTKEGIVAVLKANGLFGLAVPVDVKSEFRTGELENNYYVEDLTQPGGRRSLITNPVDEPPTEYEIQRQYMQAEVAKVQSSQLTGGLYTDVQNDLENNTRTKLTNLTREFRDIADAPVRISRELSASINAITTKIDGILFRTLPRGVRDALRPHIFRGTIPTFTNGKTFTLGGGSIDLQNGRVDFGSGDFAVDLSKLTDKQSSTLAAESVIAETGAVNGDASALANEIKKETEGNKKLSDAPPQETVDINGPPVPIDTSTIWPGGNNVSSVEELEYEMASATRDITEIIVHWSETYTDANLSMGQVPGGPGYHFVIKRDGSIERATPLNAVGNHCPTNGHNAYSIGVCLVGGVNVATGDEGIENLGANSITRSQFNSLYQIFRTFFNQYPGGQALGHMDVDISQDDPGFDVRDYVYNNFNKTSLYTDPLSQAALSPADILKALDGQGPTVLEKDPDLMDKKF